MKVGFGLNNVSLSSLGHAHTCWHAKCTMLYRWIDTDHSRNVEICCETLNDKPWWTHKTMHWHLFGIWHYMTEHESKETRCIQINPQNHTNTVIYLNNWRGSDQQNKTFFRLLSVDRAETGSTETLTEWAVFSVAFSADVWKKKIFAGVLCAGVYSVITTKQTAVHIYTSLYKIHVLAALFLNRTKSIYLFFLILCSSSGHISSRRRIPSIIIRLYCWKQFT